MTVSVSIVRKLISRACVMKLCQSLILSLDLSLETITMLSLKVIIQICISVLLLLCFCIMFYLFQLQYKSTNTIVEDCNMTFVWKVFDSIQTALQISTVDKVCEMVPQFQTAAMAIRKCKTNILVMFQTSSLL